MLFVNKNENVIAGIKINAVKIWTLLLNPKTFFVFCKYNNQVYLESVSFNVHRIQDYDNFKIIWLNINHKKL